jgi:hypothetical protein
MAFASLRSRSRYASLMQRARTLRVAPGRPAPHPRSFGRLGGVSGLRYRRMARGGFFKSIGKLVKGVAKVVKTVTSVPVIGKLAKAAVGSLPLVGQVKTAVSAFKRHTPVGIAASPVGGVTPPAHALNTMTHAAARRPGRRKAKAKRKAKRRAAKSSRKGGGSAKQRAARARFAAAARKGRIKKGARLGR